MIEKDKLHEILKLVKYRIRILDEIEARLKTMLNYAVRAKEVEIIEKERQAMQREINQLIDEIHLLERNPTEHS